MEKNELIEKYLTGALSASESTEFDTLLVNDADFKKTLAFQQDFMQSVKAVGRKDLVDLFQQAETELIAEKKAAGVGVLEQIKTGIKKDFAKVAYTLEQLTQMFRPVPTYQLAINNTLRAGAVSIEVPENGVDCSQGSITFERRPSMIEDYELLIENNDYDTLIEEDWEAGTQRLTIDLPESAFLPGRYYWKLIEDGEMVVIREFFVQKALMPA